MPNTKVALSDVYSHSSGAVVLSGIQALVRLPMVQIARDRRAGLNTGGFISGYRGSPLGGYDIALHRAQRELAGSGIVVRPAVNEELAATAVWGTQQLPLSPGRKKDGVFAIWYGKGPGVDRAGDAFKHGNAAGSSRYGGVLCLAGDDHGAKSSTIPHQSDHAFMSALIPILYPSSVHEFVRMGLLGIAMSRFSGCWVAMKLISDTVESCATVDLDGEDLHAVLPDDCEIPAGGLNFRWPDPSWQQDHRLQTYKGYAARAFGRANGVDRVVLDPGHVRFGIVASGKAFEDVREALALLGIGNDVAARIGLRLLKIGMPWPLEPSLVRSFSEGLEEILVVEERREMVENQIKQHLFNWRADVRPRIVGKFDEHDAPCLPLDNEISADLVAEVLVSRLRPLAMPEGLLARLEDRLAVLIARRKELARYVPPTLRLPYFCPGCPHNGSTRVPEGSRGLAGIGCHYMAQWMDRRTETFTQMGGEGVTWLGIAPFTSEEHVFANLGDGTYFHSGILAIRQAVAAGVNVTYKILFNSAVAMTGGQELDGQLSVPQLTRQLRDEGVRQIYLLAPDPDRYASAGLAEGTILRPREAIDVVMEEARRAPGCTAIVYDQMCATELRRKRHRGTAPPPAERAYIHPLVCEGCGDCSTQSNCIAIEPLETEFGRKREINQSACNSDLSCLKGFCPSFVTVTGGSVRKGAGIPLPDLPLQDPLQVPSRLGEGGVYNVVITGIGGTGVLTVGHILGMAAHIDEVGAMVLDMTGLAQKGGAVVSHVRLSRATNAVTAPRVPLAGADLILAQDVVVAASAECLRLGSPDRTRAIVDTHTAPVANFVHDRDFDFRMPQNLAEIERATRGPVMKRDFHTLAVRALGDAIAANMMIVGYAYQSGLLPLSEAALLQAVELNATSVEFNRQAFRWGRYAAAYPEQVDAALAGHGQQRPLAAMSLDEIIEHRMRHLAAYQGRRLAACYRDAVAKIRSAENRVAGKDAVARAVAINYAKLLAYKDEYEVARLFSDPAFKRGIDEVFDGSFTLSFHLAPPLLAPIDPNLRRPKKLRFGQWILPVFRFLAALRFLRGTPLDPFGRSEERRRERRLIRTYEDGLDLIASRLNAQTHAAAVALASAPDMVRGFGPVKLAALDKFDREWEKLRNAFVEASTSPALPPHRTAA